MMLKTMNDQINESADSSKESDERQFEYLAENLFRGEKEIIIKLGDSKYRLRITKAGKLIREAAQKGDPDAQFHLGVMFENGRGMPRNIKKAVKWYRKAAKQGHVDAQYTLSVLHRSGYGVQRDNRQAEEDAVRVGIFDRGRCRRPPFGTKPHILADDHHAIISFAKSPNPIVARAPRHAAVQRIPANAAGD